MGKHNTPGVGPDQHWRDVAAKYDEVAHFEPRQTASYLDGARHLVVSFGTTGSFVDYVVDDLRDRGPRARHVPPGHPVAVPERRAAAAAAAHCEHVLVYELNAGQMVDDVRLAVNGAVPVHSIGGVSQDESGMRQGELLGVDTMRARILAAIEGADR